MFSCATYVRRYGNVVRTYVLLIPRFVRYFIAVEGGMYKSHKAIKRIQTFCFSCNGIPHKYDLLYLFEKK